MRNRRAFTLVEVLLALLILGMVMGSVGLVLHAGVGGWRAASELAEESHDAEAVMEQIVMALRSAYYPANGDTDYQYGFQHEDDGEGDAARDTVSWVKIGSSLVGEDVSWAGSAHRVNLFVSDDEDGQGPGLYVTAWQLVGLSEDFDPEEEVEPLLLSDQVSALDVRMQDPTKATEAGEPYEWIDTWDLSNRIPDHVIVTLAMKPREKNQDPDVLVRMVEIPLSAVSWNPSKPGGGRNDRGRRDKIPSAGPEAVREGGEPSGRGRRRSGSDSAPGTGGFRGRGSGGSGGPGGRGSGGSGGSISIEGIDNGRVRLRTGGRP